MVLWLGFYRHGRTLGSVLGTKPAPHRAGINAGPNSLSLWELILITLCLGKAPNCTKDGVGQDGRAELRTSTAPSICGHASLMRMRSMGDTGCSGESCLAQDTPCHSWKEFVWSQIGVAELSWRTVTLTPPLKHPLAWLCSAHLPLCPSVELGSLERVGVQGSLCQPPRFIPLCLVPLTHTGISRDSQLCVWMGRNETPEFPAGFVNLRQRLKRVLKNQAFPPLPPRINLHLFVCLRAAEAVIPLGGNKTAKFHTFHGGENFSRR